MLTIKCIYRVHQILYEAAKFPIFSFSKSLKNRWTLHTFVRSTIFRKCWHILGLNNQDTKTSLIYRHYQPDPICLFCSFRVNCKSNIYDFSFHGHAQWLSFKFYHYEWFVDAIICLIPASYMHDCFRDYFRNDFRIITCIALRESMDIGECFKSLRVCDLNQKQ